EAHRGPQPPESGQEAAPGGPQPLGSPLMQLRETCLRGEGDPVVPAGVQAGKAYSSGLDRTGCRQAGPGEQRLRAVVRDDAVKEAGVVGQGGAGPPARMEEAAPARV